MSRARPRRRLRWWQSLLRQCDGTATVEFALIAPILAIGVLATADIGLAIHESAEIDQALRNGAEIAIDDPGTSSVSQVLAAVDEADGRGVATSWTVNRFCACPEAPASSVGCFTTCQNNRPTAISTPSTARAPIAAFSLPARILERSAVVQIR